MRAICTSASLQASTWVSPGFTLFRHSSPPFGSKQAHSNATSVEAGRCWVSIEKCTPLVLRPPFQYERWYLCRILSLARLFDSLVRVSRRVEAPHFQRQEKLEHHGKVRRSRRRRGFYARHAVRRRTLLPLALPVPLFCTLFARRASRNRVGRMLRWSALAEKMKWRYVHCRCHDFRFYVTLFPKCFSNFRSRYLFAIGLPTLYLTLADTYLPLHTALPSSATLLMLFHEAAVSGSTG